jgi:uncharacterized delta-60 repeat protein
MRFLPGGAADNSFAGDGLATAFDGGLFSSATINGLALQPDGKIVAAGTFSPFIGSDSMAVGRFNLDGSLDTTFGGGTNPVTTPFGVGFPGVDASALGVALQADGKIVAVGQADNDFAVARYENDRLQLASPVFSGGEGSTALVTITRVGGQRGAVSALLSVVGGSALPGQDYLFTPLVVTFAEGQTTQTVAIPLIGDAFVEGTETIQLALSNATGGASLGSPSSATLLVQNVAPPPLQDISALVQVTRGKAKRIGTRYRQKVTVRNLGSQALHGPLTLLLQGLNRKVKLQKQAGKMQGSPFLVLDPSGPLQAGETRTFTIRFRSTSGKKIKYTPRVLAGIGAP